MTFRRIIKLAIKNTIAHILYYSGFLKIISLISLKNRAVILLYHRVIPDGYEVVDHSPDGMTVSEKNFKMHLDTLNKWFNIRNLDDLLEDVFDQGKPFPESCCSITFDDGWLDVYTTAFPALKKRGLPATVFVTIDYVDNTLSFWEERLRFIIANLPGEGEKRLGRILSDLQSSNNEVRDIVTGMGEAGGDRVGGLIIRLRGQFNIVLGILNADLEKKLLIGFLINSI